MSHPPQIFAIVYRPGPSWIPGKSTFEQPLRPHALFMKQLFEAGILQLGGPFVDEGGGGQSVVRVAHRAEAETIIRDDPAVQEGILIAELHQWHQVDWANFGKPAPEA